MDSSKEQKYAHLKRVDFSLHEFFQAAWYNGTRAKSNRDALDILLTPTKDLPKWTRPTRHTETGTHWHLPDENESFVKRHQPECTQPKYFASLEEARTYAMAKQQDGQVFTWTYQRLWYQRGFVRDILDSVCYGTHYLYHLIMPWIESKTGLELTPKIMSVRSKMVSVRSEMGVSVRSKIVAVRSDIVSSKMGVWVRSNIVNSEIGVWVRSKIVWLWSMKVFGIYPFKYVSGTYASYTVSKILLNRVVIPVGSALFVRRDVYRNFSPVLERSFLEHFYNDNATLLEALQYRWRFMVTYFRVHKFYHIEQWVLPRISVRGTLHALIPVATMGIALQRTACVSTVSSQRLEEDATLFGYRMSSFPEKLCAVNHGLAGLDQPDLHSTVKNVLYLPTTRESRVEDGEEIEEEVKFLDIFMHPMEFLTSMHPLYDYRREHTVDMKLGKYAFSVAETEQMPKVVEPENPPAQDEVPTPPPPFRFRQPYLQLRRRDKIRVFNYTDEKIDFLTHQMGFLQYKRYQEYYYQYRMRKAARGVRLNGVYKYLKKYEPTTFPWKKGYFKPAPARDPKVRRIYLEYSTDLSRVAQWAPLRLTQYRNWGDQKKLAKQVRKRSAQQKETHEKKKEIEEKAERTGRLVKKDHLRKKYFRQAVFHRKSYSVGSGDDPNHMGLKRRRHRYNPQLQKVSFEQYLEKFYTRKDHTWRRLPEFTSSPFVSHSQDLMFSNLHSNIPVKPSRFVAPVNSLAFFQYAFLPQSGALPEDVSDPGKLQYRSKQVKAIGHYNEMRKTGKAVRQDISAKVKKGVYPDLVTGLFKEVESERQERESKREEEKSEREKAFAKIRKGFYPDQLECMERAFKRDPFFTKKTDLDKSVARMKAQVRSIASPASPKRLDPKVRKANRRNKRLLPPPELLASKKDRKTMEVKKANKWLVTDGDVATFGLKFLYMRELQPFQRHFPENEAEMTALVNLSEDAECYAYDDAPFAEVDTRDRAAWFASPRYALFRKKTKYHIPKHHLTRHLKKDDIFKNDIFLEPTQYHPWNEVTFLSIAVPILIYAMVGFAARLEFRGITFDLFNLFKEVEAHVEQVIPHINRTPAGLKATASLNQRMNTAEIQRLLSAFQTKRGEDVYLWATLQTVWSRTIKPHLSMQQKASLTAAVKTMGRLWTKKRIAVLAPPRVRMLERLAFFTPPAPVTRLGTFEQLTHGMQHCVFQGQNLGVPITARELAQRQQVFNKVGGEMSMRYGVDGTYHVQNEIYHSPLRAAIQPGSMRLSFLPKGMILLGEPGNGKTYFVRTLTTESRLRLLVTDSNRYLDEKKGLMRLKVLFKRARAQSPNILYIRDLDFMTRDRERYDTVPSVRTTTHFLLSVDGYASEGSRFLSKREIFIIGNMETTAMMDPACMRSGRLEWLVQFYYPLLTERRNMFALHSGTTLVNTALNIDWAYFSTMSAGFTCLDIRMVLNTSAVHVLQQRSTTHTQESVVFGLGTANHVHDVAESTFVDRGTQGFFPLIDFTLRTEPVAEHASFFTQTGSIPIYKKLMHLFRLVGVTDTAVHWNMPSPDLGFQTVPEWNSSVINGLVPLFCEGLLLSNLDKTCGPPYSSVTFDSYCTAQTFTLKGIVDEILVEHTLEGLTKELTFLSTFSRWHDSHSPKWTNGFLAIVKPLMFRTAVTTNWRARRVQQRYSATRGLTEMEKSSIFGVASISETIHNRLTFIAEKRTEVSSLDMNLFGLFETEYELATMRKKKKTTRRTVQLARELGQLMEKRWRHV
jgi:hypothetical protein